MKVVVVAGAGCVVVRVTVVHDRYSTVTLLPWCACCVQVARMVSLAVCEAIYQDVSFIQQLREHDLYQETAHSTKHAVNNLSCILDFIIDLCTKQHLCLSTSPTSMHPSHVPSHMFGPAGGHVEHRKSQSLPSVDPLLPLTSGSSYARSRRRSSELAGSRLVFSSPPVDSEDDMALGHTGHLGGMLSSGGLLTLAQHGVTVQPRASPLALSQSPPEPLPAALSSTVSAGDTKCGTNGGNSSSSSSADAASRDWLGSPLPFDCEHGSLRPHSPSMSVTATSNSSSVASPSGMTLGRAFPSGTLTRCVSENGIVSLPQRRPSTTISGGGSTGSGLAGDRSRTDEVLRKVLSAHSLQSLSPEDAVFVTSLRLWLEISRAITFALLHLSPVDAVGEEDSQYMALLKCAVQLAFSSVVIMEFVTLRIISNFPDHKNRSDTGWRAWWACRVCVLGVCLPFWVSHCGFGASGSDVMVCWGP